MDTETLRERCGNAKLEAPNEVVAGTFGSWAITYRVGRIGMDDGSRLKVAVNQSSDWGPPQFTDPTTDNFCSVSTSGDATVSASWNSRGWKRPWGSTIDVDVSGGALAKGEEITLILGDRSEGSLGIQAQTYPESEYQFRVFVDPFETTEYVEIPDSLGYSIVPGATEALVAVAPSQADLGEPIRVSVRAEDQWGNSADDGSTEVCLKAHTAANTPESVTISEGIAHATVTFHRPGTHRVTVVDDDTGLEATTNAIDCREAHDGRRTFWGDIHGQSGETIGTGTIEEYFTFARDTAFLDFASHAGNDFQITDEFWDRVMDVIRTEHEPGRFVTFPCYEWSANTPAGGDHNVYFRDDTAELHRSSKWQVADTEERAMGTYPSTELYNRYAGRDDVMIIPHQGGRPATLEALDPSLTPFVEIVSVWGVFEWFGHQALEEGHRVGFVGGTDDHTGRPGASSPTNVTDWAFPIEGGLMGVKAEELTRKALWEAFQARRVFATTGVRIDLTVSIGEIDMGGTVTVDGSPKIEATVRGTAPIRSIELLRDGEIVDAREFGTGSDWIECRWSGARAKTRHKTQEWTGGLSLDAGQIITVDPFGFDHPQQGIADRTSTIVRWSGSTAGNVQGIRFRYDGPRDATMTVGTPVVQTECRMSDLSEGQVIEAGGVGRRLECRETGRSSTIDAEVTFIDEDVRPGEHAYHVRVEQADANMAWSSPIFTTVE